MYLLVYVDDIMVVSLSISAADRLVSTLSGDFAIKNLGKVHFFLGLEVAHTVVGLMLTRQKYSLNLPRHAGMLK
jgi:histone deacetylase 1/2